MNKLVILKLHEGNFEEKGFSASIEIMEYGTQQPLFSQIGHLPPMPDILKLFSQWQEAFRAINLRLGGVSKPKKFSSTQSAKELEMCLNRWLNCGDKQWQRIRDGLLMYLRKQDIIRVLIQTTDNQLRQLPWPAWDLFTEYYTNTEIILGVGGQRKISSQTGKKVRILAVLGHSNSINTKFDQDELKKKALGAEIEFLELPTKNELFSQLRNEQGWHIFFFAGHSSSNDKGQIGQIEINQNESLKINDFKNAFLTAIDRNLQLAIFNSCDGLGLANQLAELGLPQSIVMRESIPDKVAHEFLKHFLAQFVGYKNSLYSSVREARLNLEHFNGDYPGVIWLPVICQNLTVEPLNWNKLRKSREKYRVIEKIELRQKSGKCSDSARLILEESSIHNALGFMDISISDNPENISFERYAFINSFIHNLIAPGKILLKKNASWKEKASSNEFISFYINSKKLTSYPIEKIPVEYRNNDYEYCVIESTLDYPKTYTGPRYSKRLLIFVKGLGIVFGKTEYKNNDIDIYRLRDYKIQEEGKEFWFPIQVGNYWVYEIDYEHGTNKLNMCS
jgi:hypothetical protein